MERAAQQDMVRGAGGRPMVRAPVVPPYSSSVSAGPGRTALVFYVPGGGNFLLNVPQPCRGLMTHADSVTMKGVKKTANDRLTG